MSNEQEMRVPLSERLRPDVECAPWVIEEVRKLEADARRMDFVVENSKDMGNYTELRVAIHDGETWHGTLRNAIDAALSEHKENHG